MFAWPKMLKIISNKQERKPVSALERGKEIAKELDAQFHSQDQHVSVGKIVECLDNLYVLAMMHDGTLFKYSRNDSEANMLMESFVVLSHFAHNHKHYISPLPHGKAVGK